VEGVMLSGAQCRVEGDSDNVNVPVESWEGTNPLTCWLKGFLIERLVVESPSIAFGKMPISLALPT
jgi:hypothetical protein